MTNPRKNPFEISREILNQGDYQKYSLSLIRREIFVAPNAPLGAFYSNHERGNYHLKDNVVLDLKLDNYDARLFLVDVSEFKCFSTKKYYEYSTEDCPPSESSFLYCKGLIKLLRDELSAKLDQLPKRRQVLDGLFNGFQDTTFLEHVWNLHNTQQIIGEFFGTEHVYDESYAYQKESTEREIERAKEIFQSAQGSLIEKLGGLSGLLSNGDDMSLTDIKKWFEGLGPVYEEIKEIIEEIPQLKAEIALAAQHTVECMPYLPTDQRSVIERNIKHAITQKVNSTINGMNLTPDEKTFWLNYFGR